MTTSGDVDTTVAMTRVWHQPSVLGDTPVRRLAAVPAPFQGTSLPAAARISTPAIFTTDVPFRTGRPPV